MVILETGVDFGRFSRLIGTMTSSSSSASEISSSVCSTRFLFGVDTGRFFGVLVADFGTGRFDFVGLSLSALIKYRHLSLLGGPSAV